MKKTIIAAGLLIATIVALTSFTSLAVATDPVVDPIWLAGPIYVSANGNSMWLSTEGMFVGSDVTEVHIFFEIDGVQIESATPKNLVLNNNKVGVVFNSKLLPESEVTTTRIDIYTAEAVYAVSGPGFYWTRGR
jgi:hypothetical protein